MLQHLDEKVTLKSETDDDLVKQLSLVLTGEPEKLSDLKKIINNEMYQFWQRVGTKSLQLCSFQCHMYKNIIFGGSTININQHFHMFRQRIPTQ